MPTIFIGIGSRLTDTEHEEKLARFYRDTVWTRQVCKYKNYTEIISK